MPWRRDDGFKHDIFSVKEGGGSDGGRREEVRTIGKIRLP